MTKWVAADVQATEAIVNGGKAVTAKQMTSSGVHAKDSDSLLTPNRRCIHLPRPRIGDYRFDRPPRRRP